MWKAKSRGRNESGSNDDTNEFDTRLSLTFIINFIKQLNRTKRLFKWALKNQVANKEKDAIDNYILGTKHS
nr:4410_t:CDS:2 [Entrophospora candida]